MCFIYSDCNGFVAGCKNCGVSAQVGRRGDTGKCSSRFRNYYSFMFIALEVHLFQTKS